MCCKSDFLEHCSRVVGSVFPVFMQVSALQTQPGEFRKELFATLPYAHLISPVEHELRRTVIFAPHGFLHGVPLHALFDGIREVEEAASLVQSGTVLKNPSIDEFRDALRAPRRILHIAGHAGIDTVTGKISWIETGDGRLTNRDLTEMNIRAKTLVITGCQTARRIIQPGDEWLGLMRSFYMSGAGTIVSAFWDIRDEAARRFSSEFYKTFEEQNALFAARSASQAVRGWRTHPYFWAGFAVFVRKFQETNQ